MCVCVCVCVCISTSAIIGAFESIRKCLKEVKTRDLVEHMPAKEKSCFVELKERIEKLLADKSLHVHISMCSLHIRMLMCNLHVRMLMCSLHVRMSIYSLHVHMSMCSLHVLTFC